jgi:dihydroxyacid dehydratase/phosphogluconate dehydratase
MDARTNIKGRLPDRQATEGPSRAQHDLRNIIGEIFKGTPDVADLKPCSRDVAKDIVEIAGISLLMKTLLDTGHLYGDCITFPGRTNAEDLKSAKRGRRQDLARPAVAKVAVMSKSGFTGPARRFHSEELFLLPDSDIRAIDSGLEALNANLTGNEPAEHQTKWKSRATNHRSGALWTHAQQVGPAMDGAVTHPGGAHERQSYVGI